MLRHLCFLVCALPPGAAPPTVPPLGPHRPAVPASSRFANPVDRFLDRYFQQHGIAWPEPASDAVFTRRAYLDIWGLLPTPAQLRALPSDRAQLVRSLLADGHHYAEHWITFWNDLLRNDEGVVYHGTRESITNWLYGALERNMPYDLFVSELLNPVRPDDPKGFLIGVNWRGAVSASQIPPMQAAQNSAQVFLGVNLKCNSCHDSFISYWKLKDAYGLASFFSNEPLELYRCDKKTGATAEAKFLYPELGSVSPDATPEERRALAARLFTEPADGRFARTFVNRIWDRLFGRGLVPSVDDLDRPAWNPDLLDWLAADFVDHRYDVRHLLEQIMTSRAYQLPAVPEAKAPDDKWLFRGPLPRRLTAEQFADAVSSVTGQWPVLTPQKSGAGTYVRDWRLKSNPLTRALGRPIRDQVFTERNREATTLQALEEVNGETLQNLLHRGALRMLGRLRPPPENLFDSGVLSSKTAAADIDISGARRLWLLLEDADSYDPSRTVARWRNAILEGPRGTVRLADLQPVEGQAQAGEAGVTAPLGSALVYDVAGYTRFRATVGVDADCVKNDINPRVRFFVFREEPDREQLVRVAGEPPVAPPPGPFTADTLIARIYEHALGRQPAAPEQQIARQMLGEPLSSDGLEDLLWAVFLSPEFQYIH